MLNLLKTITILGTLLFLFCTKVDFNNPLDSNGTAFDKTDKDGDGVADILEDDDDDGIPNKYDKDSEQYVKDTIKPVFSTSGNDTIPIAIGTIYDYKANVRAEDNVEGDITSKITINSSAVSSLSPGVYPVTYTVSDLDENSASITRYVRVFEPVAKDEVAPKINFGNDTVTLMVGDVYNEIKATAWDAVDGDVPVSSSGTVNTAKAGSYPITYTATDKSNNIATRVKTVIVEAGSDVDGIKPELVLKGKDTMAVATFAEYIEPGFTANDNHDGDITSKVKTDFGQFKAGAAAGLYLIKYSVQDSAGNSTTENRYVCLNCESIDTTDTTKPVLSVTGGLTTYSIEKGSKTKVVTAIDNVDGNITESVKRTGNFDSTKADTYTLTYTVSDKAGNVAILDVKITVKADSDTTKPVITLKGKIRDTVYVDSIRSYVDSGATAKDSGKLITVPTVSGTVDLTTIGSYTLTYTATDAAGNVATATRTVVVKELDKSLLARYGVLSAAPLETINKIYTSFKVEDSGPTFSTMKSMSFNWNYDEYNKALYAFSISTASGQYIELKPSVNTLGSPSPTITLASTGITDLDGIYYVVLKDTNMIWVKKDGSYAIVWSL